MKKRYLKIYLSIYLSIVIIISLFLNNSFYSFADVPSTQKVVGHNSSWGNYDFNYVFHRKYFTIQDPTGIPTAPISAPYFFYTEDNQKFYTISGTDLIQLILNRGIGIILEPNRASALIQSFFLAITQPDLQNLAYAQGGLYDGSGNFLGYCLNDISGCYYEGIPNDGTPDINIPSETTNNVYNYYNYYKEDHGIPVDYFTLYTPSRSFILSHYMDLYNVTVAPPYSGSDIPRLVLDRADISIAGGYDIYSLNMYYNSDATQYDYVAFGYNYDFYATAGTPYHIIGNNSQWDNFCNQRGLINGNNELLFSEMWLHPEHKSVLNLSVYDNSDTLNKYAGKNEFIPSTAKWWEGSSQVSMYLGNGGQVSGRQVSGMLYGRDITIYKDLNVYNGINVNKNYKSNIYITKIYKTYNTNNDNSIKTTTIDIDNAPQNNTDIRDDISDVINNNEDNSIINNNTINTNNIDDSVTEITINIYNNTTKPNTNNDPGNNPNNPDDPDNPTNPDNPDNPTNPDDPDNPTNPDDPDNPTNPDDPDDGDSILDKLLAAILKLFDTIGKLLATVLTGIITVLDDVLSAIGDIMTSLTGVVDFFTALFGWIPEPVPQVLALGFSITILCALIKFIRG